VQSLPSFGELEFPSILLVAGLFRASAISDTMMDVIAIAKIDNATLVVFFMGNTFVIKQYYF